jgi:aspartyl-tRNA(Asn)/glutamyl-tRNA(Gln) amidotransferase subunit C
LEGVPLIDYSQINRELVQYIARAAHINLSEEDINKYLKQFEAILKTFAELDNLDTENVEPSFHPIHYENVMRDDIAIEWIWDPLENTKHKEKSYFKGPKIA